MLCPVCSGWKLTPLGIGTESVADEAKRLFPDAPLVIIDKEHAKTPKQIKKIVDEFYATPGSILVGTELALAHLRDTIDTVAITSFDSLFSVPSFRIGEKIISLVARLEEMTKTHFVLQTKNTDEPIIRDIISGNLAEAYKNELAIRKTLGFPPFTTFIKLGVASKQPQAEALRDVVTMITSDMNAELFAPTVHKTKAGYTTHIAIKVGTNVWSPDCVIRHPDIARTFAAKITTLGHAYKAIVDPYDLG
jgi:primosomal protein N' (replication factor Y)